MLSSFSELTGPTSFCARASIGGNVDSNPIAQVATTVLLERQSSVLRLAFSDVSLTTRAAQ
jgi:hypothetical protein